MRCASALSTRMSTDEAIAEVVDRTAAAMEGETADLVVVFASMHHAGGVANCLDYLGTRGLGRHVMGCTGESIVGDGREIEESPALCVWAASLPGATVQPLRVTFDDGAFSDLPDDVRSSLLLLGDPFTFPADEFLKQINEEKRGLRLMGGMASGSRVPGGNRLILDGETYKDGAVAVGIEGPVVLRSVVSQGCRPIGRPFVVTRTEHNIVRELGRRPALEVLRELYEAASPDDRDRIQQGLHLGRVINEYQETFQRGDFLVRNVLGADEAGGIAINDHVRVGQTVQFHVRDEESAREDLRGMLETERGARPESAVQGALLFSCNGRGTRLFSQPHHDVTLIRDAFGPIPVAGFFAMGEIGPVGGQNFLHGYTASVVLFEERAASPA